MPTAPGLVPPTATQRLAGQLEALGVLPDARALAAARALLAETGQVDMRQLEQLTRALAQLGSAGAREARAAALLLVHGVEPTPELVMDLREHAAESAGERLALLAKAGGRAAEVLGPLELPASKEGLPGALRKLVQAFTSPEADLAAGRPGHAPERLVGQVHAALAAHPEDASLVRLATETRLAQLPHQTDPALVVPFWGPMGAGEVRVQPDAQDAGVVGAEGPRGTRLVLAMETPELDGLRFDCHLTPGQVNCHVVAADPAVATFLAAHVDELRQSLEGAGFAVPHLVITAARPASAGLDMYG